MYIKNINELMSNKRDKHTFLFFAKIIIATNTPIIIPIGFRRNGSNDCKPNNKKTSDNIFVIKELLSCIICIFYN